MTTTRTTIAAAATVLALTGSLLTIAPAATAAPNIPGTWVCDGPIQATWKQVPCRARVKVKAAREGMVRNLAREQLATTAATWGIPLTGSPLTTSWVYNKKRKTYSALVIFSVPVPWWQANDPALAPAPTP